MRRLLFTLLGIAVGAGAGAATGFAAGSAIALVAYGDSGLEVLGFVMFLGLLGAGVGAVIGGAAGFDPTPRRERVICAGLAIFGAAALITMIAG